VRGSFTRGTPHERYEQFMEYAEEHPQEVIEAISGAAARDAAVAVHQVAEVAGGQRPFDARSHRAVLGHLP
jgi:hypothetical protein